MGCCLSHYKIPYKTLQNQIDIQIDEEVNSFEKLKIDIPIEKLDTLEKKLHTYVEETITNNTQSNNIKTNYTFHDYDHGREIFDALNEIRLTPGSYIEYLNEFIASLDSDEDVLFIDFQKYPFYSLNKDKTKYQLNHGIAGLNDLKLLLEANKYNTFDPILWSEIIYTQCMIDLNNLNNPEIQYTDDDESDCNVNYTNSFYSKVRSNFQQKISSLIEGNFVPLLSAIMLISNEPLTIMKLMLCENYEAGACYYTRNDNDYKHGIVLITLGMKKHREQRLLEFPLIHVKDHLDLNNPLFEYIDYKSNIAEGSFKIENGILIAYFTLDDNSNKIERIVLS